MTAIEAKRRRITSHETEDTREKNRSSNISGDSVDFEGNVVRANRGIVSVSDDSMNKSFIDSFGVTRNYLVVDPKESSSVASGFVYPLVTPEVRQKFVNPYWVVCDAVICVSEGSDGFFACRKGAANGSKLIESNFG